MTNSLDVVYPNVSHPGNQAWRQNVTARMREFEIELMKRLRLEKTGFASYEYYLKAFDFTP